MPDRSVKVRLGLDAGSFNRGLTAAGRNASAFAKNLDDVDTRMSGIVQTGLALGPALVPATAAAAGGAATLANQLGFAAVGAGTAVLAFQGVGDALTAVNDFALDPTAENLEAMREKMQSLGPAGRDFVRFLQDLRPQMQQLQTAAQAGLFPGVQEGLRDMMSLFPMFENIVANVGAAMGELADDAGEALTSPFWQDFFRWIATDASSALTQLGRTIGNVVEGVAGMTMAFDPLSDDIGSALVRMSEDFAAWGRTVGSTQGFRDFTDYIREMGPKLVETFVSLGEAFIKVAEAAAPIGGPTLAIIRGLAETLGAIADLPVIGSTLIATAAGIATLSRAVALWKAAQGSALVATLGGIDREGKRASAAMTAIGRGGAALAGVAVAVSVFDNLGKALSDTMPGLNEMQNRLLDLGRSGGPADLGPKFDDLAESIQRVADPTWGEGAADWLENLGLPPSKDLRESREQIAAIDTALAQLAATQGPRAARRAFQQMAEAQGLSQRQMRQLMQHMPAYREALQGAGLDARLTAGGTRRLTDAERDAKRATQNLARELLDLQETLEGRASMRQYEESIDAVTASIRRNGRTLDINTPKGRENQEALDGIATAALGVAENMKGLNKVRFLQQARRDFIDAAQKFGLTERQARRLADRLGLVNQNSKIDIMLRQHGMDDATQKLRRIKERADDVPTRIDTRVEGDTGDADRDLGVLADKLKDIDDTRAVPKADLKDDATRPINAVDRLLRDLGGTTAKPGVRVETNQAQRDTNSFIDFFNRSLGNIENEEVGVNLTAAAKGAVDAVVGFFTGATGGEVPLAAGTPGKDSVPALLMPGEHIFTTDDVKKAGGQRAMYAVREMIQRGEFARKGDLQYYAGGGAVGIDMPIRERGVESSISQIASMFGAFADRLSDRLSDKLNEQLQFGGGRPLGPGGTLSMGQAVMGQKFASAQAGLPYQWGGTGNPSWDCSGLVGGTWAAALGRNPYQRYFTTASFGSGGALGFAGGPGIFTVGNDPGSHMASNMGGLGVESRGGDGVVLGSGITPLTSFRYMAHYDRGGPLHPGWTLAYNGTGETEYVVRRYAEGGEVERNRDEGPTWRERVLAPLIRRHGGGSEIVQAIRDWLDGIKRKQFSEEKLAARLERQQLTREQVQRHMDPLLGRFGRNSDVAETMRDWLQNVKQGEFTRQEKLDKLARVIERELTPTLRQFRVGPNMGRSDVKDELSELRQNLRESFGRDAPILKAVDRLDNRILRTAKIHDKLVRTNERLDSRLDRLGDARRELQKSVASTFRTDPFEGSLSDLSLQLRADTNDARKMRGALARAEDKGLSGGLYRQLAQSGNLELAQQFAGLSRAQIRSYERMFATRQDVTAGLGRMVGREVFGPEMRQTRRALGRNERAIKENTRQQRRNTRALERRLERRAGTAHRRARAG